MNLSWLRRFVVVLAASQVFYSVVCMAAESSAPERHLVTIAPGHFHAALIQKEMSPDISPRVRIYAPFGSDLLAHLNRINQFNTRRDNPTSWEVEVYAAPDYWERLKQEAPGGIAVLSGNNRGKIERIRELAGMGLHVLADKPWILGPEELPVLEQVLEVAARRGVVAYDAMTQRFEITCLLLREFVNDSGVFGSPLAGTADEPAVLFASVHYLYKEVAGVPNLRPAWFFDIQQQGEGLTDVGTHLADLAAWTLFPDQALNFHSDIEVLRGERWSTRLTLAEFQKATGEREFPNFLKSALESERLEYYANNRVDYTLRGVHVRLEARWDFEAPPGGKDTELVVFRGTKSRVQARQGKEEGYRPEVYLRANTETGRAALREAVARKLEVVRKTWPGLDVEERGGEFHILIPEHYRIGHEAHFALLTSRFLGYVANPASVPAWEAPNMMAKYYITTRGVELARRSRGNQPEPATGPAR